VDGGAPAGLIKLMRRSKVGGCAVGACLPVEDPFPVSWRR
jgi:hypothetical protein